MGESSNFPQKRVNSNLLESKSSDFPHAKSDIAQAPIRQRWYQFSERGDKLIPDNTKHASGYDTHQVEKQRASVSQLNYKGATHIDNDRLESRRI